MEPTSFLLFKNQYNFIYCDQKMKNFVQSGINFVMQRSYLNEGKFATNFKKGLYSTSFNADIIPLVHLHLMKKQHPELDDASLKKKILQKYRSGDRNWKPKN